MGRAVKMHGKSKVYQYKMLGKDMLYPCKYVGKHVGHGTFMAAVNKTTNELVRDAVGRPIPYKAIVATPVA